MGEQNEFSVMDELKYLLMEMADVTHQERKEYKGELEEMLAEIQREPGQSELSEADVVRITNTYKRMAEISSQWEQDSDKAIAYYQPYLKWVREEYGEESDFVANCYEEIARLCKNCDDTLRVCEYTERALAINIREMGKMYLLPAVFRKIVVGFMKMIGKINEETKFNRIMSVSSTYCNFGECYLQMNEAQRAKDGLKKSVMFYEMVIRVSTYDHGWGHELLGDALLILNEKKKAWSGYPRSYSKMPNNIIIS